MAGLYPSKVHIKQSMPGSSIIFFGSLSLPQNVLQSHVSLTSARYPSTSGTEAFHLLKLFSKAINILAHLRFILALLYIHKPQVSDRRASSGLLNPLVFFAVVTLEFIRYQGHVQTTSIWSTHTFFIALHKHALKINEFDVMHRIIRVSIESSLNLLTSVALGP